MQPHGGVLDSLVPSFPGYPSALAAHFPSLFRTPELAARPGLRSQTQVDPGLDASPAGQGETAIVYHMGP